MSSVAGAVSDRRCGFPFPRVAYREQASEEGGHRIKRRRVGQRDRQALAARVIGRDALVQSILVVELQIRSGLSFGVLLRGEFTKEMECRNSSGRCYFRRSVEILRFIDRCVRLRTEPDFQAC